MVISKMRKQGNASMITIPKKLNPKVGHDYIIYKSTNGAFVLVPKVPDIFKNVKPNQYNDVKKIDPINYRPRGHELQ